MLTRRAATLGLTAAVAGLDPRAAAADGAVDLQLVLAVDTSGSVNHERFELQRRGYAAAFRDPQVIATIGRGRQGAIAVTMTQWTGPVLQSVVIPWTRIGPQASVAAFGDAIDGVARRLFGGGTSISGAIDHGRSMFASCPFSGPRRTIDISGDGANNRGRPAHAARDDAVADDITVNGLPIIALERDLDVHYRDNVIGGPGAFMVVAESFETFGAAVRRKLIQEIADDRSAPRVSRV